MPGSTVRAKVSKGVRGATAPVSERQQLALLMQMTSDDNQGPGPGSGPSEVGGGHGGGHGGPSAAVAAVTSPAANPSPSRSRARNERGETPLHLAAIRGDLAQVERLLEAGADPNVADFAGWTPLHEASNHGWLRVARALLRAGAHVNVKGWDDDSPLHDAAVNGHFKLVRMLMRHGADPHLRNVRGKTPLDVARQDVIFLMTDPKPFSSDDDSSDHLTEEEEAEAELAAVLAGPTSEATGAEAGDAAPSTAPGTAPGTAPDTGTAPATAASSSSTTSTGPTSTTRGQGAARALVLPRTPTRRNSTASTRGAPSEMRRATPPNKAVEKSASPRVTLRLHHVKTRDDRKGAAKPAERESTSNNRSLSSNMESKGSGDDVYEFKSSKEATPVRGASASPEPLSKLTESTSSGDGKERESKAEAPTEAVHSGAKRNATEMVDGDEGDEESRRKKRKETESSSKDTPRGSVPGRAANGRNGGANNDKSKPAASKSSSNPAGKPTANVEKNPELKSGTSSGSNSPKPSSAATTPSSLTSTKVADAEGEDSQGKTGDAVGPKVPPLKIVIPQQSATLEPEPGTRVGKNGNSRHHQALPYVVASSNSNDSTPDKEGGGSGSASPTDALDKKDSNLTEDQRSALHHQRVLRSSNRSGSGGPNPSGSRSSSPTAGSGGGEETSPQQSRQQSPAPSEAATSVVPETTSAPSPGKTTTTTTVAPISAPVEEKPGPTETNPISTQPTPAPPPQTVSMELHPRKRKLKPHREQPPAPTPNTGNTESTETSYTATEVHPHEQPITNCYQLFLNIRKQIERRRKNLFPVQPKPPQGFKDYLMNRCTYVLASNASTRIAAPNSPPATLIGGLKDLFVEQEKERQKLKMQHIIEKEKLVLSVEQEILRVHGRAARALANQALPFSACSILKDEEVYNVITPEQEEKDRNARSRYNGRLFLSWLQDVDDKWEKIKESMLLRHHNEAESLHAVQRMDWDWKVKEMGPCEDCPPPMVHVSDDFDLLPA